MAETRIGSITDFARLPAEIALGSNAYYLVKEDNEYKLLNRRCPHAGYPVEAADDCFECPLHGWTFDLTTGACQNVPSAKLQSVPVLERDGELFVQQES
jgi:nitrite reductase/ring-hydroxylating ferredoxin subunit